jgi:hypothetical protein
VFSKISTDMKILEDNLLTIFLEGVVFEETGVQEDGNIKRYRKLRFHRS